jgi:hypothetical protein
VPERVFEEEYADGPVIIKPEVEVVRAKYGGPVRVKLNIIYELRPPHTLARTINGAYFLNNPWDS